MSVSKGRPLTFVSEGKKESSMQFEPLYYGDRVKIVNPSGDVGVVTLWSPIAQVESKLAEISPEVISHSSRVAVLGNLYGDGLLAMLCNLMNNPQLKHLIALGQDLSGSGQDLEAFIERGTESATVLGQELMRIKGTNRFLPKLQGFDEARLRESLSFRYFGKLSKQGLVEEVGEYINRLPHSNERVLRRTAVEIPETSASDFAYQPSNPVAHQVSRRRPLECWRELVVRGMRFGKPVTLSKGTRLELLNAKVVIAEPEEETAQQLAEYHFSLDDFHEYQRNILDPTLPESISYTYGNRIGGYFPSSSGALNTLRTVIDHFRQDTETRHGYISIWDTASDLPRDQDNGAGRSVPCLTTLFFRKFDAQLTLSATFRSHNLLTAWLQNVYGLIAIQKFVAEAVGLPCGPITVISHSLGIDPNSTRFGIAEGLEREWDRDDDIDPDTGKPVLREDPQGYFVVSIDESRDTIVADHMFEGISIKRYEGRKSEEIERAISADMAISLISHALWLGRELAKCEQQLRRNKVANK